jgi:hypothetical protein
MKALPARLSTRTITAEVDPSITFTIEPPVNEIHSYIEGRNIEFDENTKAWNFNPGGRAYDLVGFSLTGLTGLENFALIFDDVKIGGRTFKRVKDECLDRLPKPLYDEIWTAATSSTTLLEDEVENVGFTSPSPSETSPAPETSEPATAEKDCSD